jgi:hypothetical protein
LLGPLKNDKQTVFSKHRRQPAQLVPEHHGRLGPARRPGPCERSRSQAAKTRKESGALRRSGFSLTSPLEHTTPTEDSVVMPALKATGY